MKMGAAQAARLRQDGHAQEDPLLDLINALRYVGMGLICSNMDVMTETY